MRDRKLPAKLRSPSPRADKSSPAAKSAAAASTSSSAADTPKTTRLKVKLKRSSADEDSSSSRGVTPQPGAASASGTKVTIKTAGLKKTKLADDQRDLADDDDDQEDGDATQQHDDDVAPKTGAHAATDAAEPQTYGKRDRNARSKAAGRRRPIVADDEDDEDGDEAPKAPQRKRARLSDSPVGGTKTKGRTSARGSKRAVDYSDDDDSDEEMVDAASDEDDLADAAAIDTEDEFDDDDRPSRSSKTRKGKPAADAPKKTGGRAAVTAAKAPSGAAGKKAPTASAAPAAGTKLMSAEARMRASIDAAKDKSLKPPGVSAAASSKLNPQASAFRPNSAKSGAGGSATPTGAGRPGASSTSAGAAGAKRPANGGGKPAFGKSMSGWDQLFGGISGLSTTPASNKSTATKPAGATAPGGKPPAAGTGAAAASGTGIRPDPVLEAASLEDVQRLKKQAVEEHLNTDECFDLLAHADIMLAFERSVYMEDRKLSARLRPAIWKAGAVLQANKQNASHAA